MSVRRRDRRKEKMKEVKRRQRGGVTKRLNARGSQKATLNDKSNSKVNRLRDSGMGGQGTRVRERERRCRHCHATREEEEEKRKSRKKA